MSLEAVLLLNLFPALMRMAALRQRYAGAGLGYVQAFANSLLFEIPVVFPVVLLINVRYSLIFGPLRSYTQVALGAFLLVAFLVGMSAWAVLSERQVEAAEAIPPGVSLKPNIGAWFISGFCLPHRAMCDAGDAILLPVAGHSPGASPSSPEALGALIGRQLALPGLSARHTIAWSVLPPAGLIWRDYEPWHDGLALAAVVVAATVSLVYLRSREQCASMPDLPGKALAR